jgi:hypothetical protein
MTVQKAMEAQQGACCWELNKEVACCHDHATSAGVVHFFGRLSFLVDENAHAVHFFISALLQLLDRCRGCLGWQIQR